MSLRADAMRTLDVQLDLINYYKSHAGQLHMAYFIGDQVDKHTWDAPPPGHDVNAYIANTGLRIARDIETELNNCASYYVTPEMMALTLHAAETAPTSKFTRDDPPTPSGFVMLPTPLIVRDVNGRNISARAFGWWITTVTVRTPQEDGTEFAVDVPTLMYMLFSAKSDTDVDEAFQKFRDEEPEAWLEMPAYQVVHWLPLYLDRPWADDNGVIVRIAISNSTPAPGSMSSWVAFLRAFFLLVRQEIAVPRSERYDRAHARRLAGTGFAPEYGDVQIITLRRTRPVGEEPEPGDGRIEWSHRWIVSGHWRNAYHPSCADCGALGHACGEHPQWIEAFEKGPADRPLIIKDRVFVWKR